jgi:hypothetical protein
MNKKTSPFTSHKEYFQELYFLLSDYESKVASRRYISFPLTKLIQKIIKNYLGIHYYSASPVPGRFITVHNAISNISLSTHFIYTSTNILSNYTEVL